MAKNIDEIDNDLKSVTLDKESSAKQSREGISRKSREEASIASESTSEQDLQGVSSAYLEACDLLNQYEALVTDRNINQHLLEKIVRLRVSLSAECTNF